MACFAVGEPLKGPVSMPHGDVTILPFYGLPRLSVIELAVSQSAQTASLFELIGTVALPPVIGAMGYAGFANNLKPKISLYEAQAPYRKDGLLDSEETRGQIRVLVECRFLNDAGPVI